MNRIFKSLSIIALAIFALACAQDESSLYEGLPFEMPKVQLPSIPPRSVLLTDFGGVADCSTLNTDAFSKAIDALSEQGGGRLIVPAGLWLSGPITLKDHIELFIDKDAILIFSDDPELYPIIDTNFEGLDVRRCVSPINALGAHDIAITGGGVIDGGGTMWREVKRRKVSEDQWKEILKRDGVLSDDGKVWFPNEGYKAARATAGSLNKPSDELDENYIKTFLRPVLLSLRECERVLIEDCSFQNSPCWNLHPLWCKDLTIRNINVRNPHYSANGDGIDIDACENVILTCSSFDVGDDAICIKSGKDEDGRRHARKCRNLIISDCTVYHGHGGFVVGSEMSGGVENILVRDCRFLGTDVGLRVKSARGRGGEVKDIWGDNIYMKDIVNYGIIFNLHYAGVAASELADGQVEPAFTVDETTPSFHDIHISNVSLAGPCQAVYINGLPEMPVRNVDFKNFNYVTAKAPEVHYAENISL